MIIRADFQDFVDQFNRRGRSTQFSKEGLRTLFDYLEEVNPDYELDVIELCCEYTEYDDIWEAADEYSMDTDQLRDSTMVLDFDLGCGVVIQKF